ncbi:DnaJ domain-containing protein [Hirsutella rhossiliensis]|uniref:DnaJ domain-containing protein n=1 Tax=Hirsutella rhossiliensis TaxID=111463 RepID=A0A9P8N0I2_9HYPO|nr:dnaJ domain-containing protein [Hirsutella rhossiliensis]KAH0965443.1 dnaJ domain-containing protein [Hirsutella rhossiliensis]
MMLKNSAVALCCSTCSVPSSLTSSPSPSRCFPSHPSYKGRHGSTSLRRRASTSTHSDGDAPPAWPRSSHPTPYEIFDIHKAAPYTKRRFYQLVKLYHPDTHDSHTRGPFLPSATRLERYRLVVAANDLLSDPEKRRLYDSHDRAWRHQPNSPARNATWEDWERWYEARDGRRREPTYMSNGTFATLVVMMCMVGAMTQANRAEASGAHFVESTKQRHAAIGQDMLRSSTALAGRSKDERVDSFLRDRQNVASDYAPSRCNAPSQPDRPA